MRKLLFISLTLAGTFAGEAQDTFVNKNGVAILPVAGDIGIGFNAVPVINFALNAVNIMDNNGWLAQHPGFIGHLGDNVLFGRYMLEDKIAIRGHFRVGKMGETLRNYVNNDTQNDPDSLVLDELTYSESNITIGGGYEFRRGKGRIQGIYGGDVFVMSGRNKSDFAYGNAFGQVNPAPTSTDFNSGAQSGGFESMPMAERIVSSRGSNSFGLGIRPFVGIEYFFFPNISLGAEFGWTLSKVWNSESETTMELVEQATGNVLQSTDKVAGSKGTYIDTETFNGALFLMFYF